MQFLNALRLAEPQEIAAPQSFKYTMFLFDPFMALLQLRMLPVFSVAELNLATISVLRMSISYSVQTTAWQMHFYVRMSFKKKGSIVLVPPVSVQVVLEAAKVLFNASPVSNNLIGRKAFKVNILQ